MLLGIAISASCIGILLVLVSIFLVCCEFDFLMLIIPLSVSPSGSIRIQSCLKPFNVVPLELALLYGRDHSSLQYLVGPIIPAALVPDEPVYIYIVRVHC